MTYQYCFDTQFARKIYKDICKTDRYSIRCKLIYIAKKHGMDEKTAKETADEILAGIQVQRDTVKSFLQSPPSHGMEMLCSALNSSFRHEALTDKLYLGMLYSDDAAFQQELKKRHGDSMVYCSEYRVAETFEEKRDMICETVHRFGLSEEKLEQLVRRLTSGHDPVAIAFELTQQNMTRSAILAMHFYLKHRKVLKPREAAVLSCTMEDSKVIHDAVIAGMDRKEEVEGEIGAACLVMCGIALMALVGCAMIGEVVCGMVCAALCLVFYGLPGLLRKPIGTLFGKSRVRVQTPMVNQFPAPATV